MANDNKNRGGQQGNRSGQESNRGNQGAHGTRKASTETSEQNQGGQRSDRSSNHGQVNRGESSRVSNR